MSWLYQLVYNPACLVVPGGAWMGSCIAERGLFRGHYWLLTLGKPCQTGPLRIKRNSPPPFSKKKKKIIPQTSHTYAAGQILIKPVLSLKTDEIITKIKCPPWNYFNPFHPRYEKIYPYLLPDVSTSSSSTQAQLFAVHLFNIHSVTLSPQPPIPTYLKKPASDESTTDEEEMIAYDVEDEIESNPDYVKKKCNVVTLHTSLQAVAVRIHVHSLVTVCCVYLPPNDVVPQVDLNHLIEQLISDHCLLSAQQRRENLFPCTHEDISHSLDLLYLFNRIWREQVYPTQWQEAIVIPILKPGKDPKNLLSYRPIALTSCLCSPTHTWTIYRSATVKVRHAQIERQLQNAAVNINIIKWCDNNGHSISASKSCCVHFCRKRGIHPDPEHGCTRKPLENYHDRCHPVVCTILDITSRLYSKGFDIVFCWLPSHVGIIRQRASGQRGKVGDDPSAARSSLSDMKRVILHHIFKIWRESWSQQLDNKLHSVKPVMEHGL
ncbi:RNase H domain-containing protein [Trichonephila clavipes]|nr:RNase H domain-containing protein [Trichonephila clavipes]